MRARSVSVRVRRGLFVVLCCALVSFVTVVGVTPPVRAHRVTSWNETRWRGVHPQQTDASCGPASVVTLMRLFYGMSVEEADVYALAWAGVSSEHDDTTVLWGSTSLHGLAVAMQHYGFETVGLTMDVQMLRHYFTHVGLPLIAHVNRPTRHFFVIVGFVDDDNILILDPSQGSYIMSRTHFEARSSGHFLAYVPPVPIDESAVHHALHQAQTRRNLLIRVGGDGKGRVRW